MCTKGFGLTVHDINWSCPSELEPYVDCYMLEHKEIDANAHLQGMYVLEALKSTVCNMFGNKNSDPFKYPEKPFTQLQEHREEDMQKQRELFLASLKIMQSNFNASKEGKNEHSSSVE